MGRHGQGNARETHFPGSMGCAGVQMDGWPRQRALRSNSWTGTGARRTQSRCGGWKEQDHIVALVDVRRAYFSAELLPTTLVELFDYVTWIPGQDAAGDCGVACTGRGRLQGRGNVK